MVVWASDLEADPEVVAFCERPALSELEAPGASIDFWVRRSAGEEFVSVVGAAAASEVPQQLDGLPVRRFIDAGRAARRVWITNWQRMLPVVNATGGCCESGYSWGLAAVPEPARWQPPC
jgi:hypothetical protein